MAFQQQPTGDIRATVTITQSEAINGTTRALNLPGGRQITLSIPPGTRDGQEMRMPGQGLSTWNGGPSGNLIITVAIAPAEYFGSVPYASGETNKPTDYIQQPPPPPNSSSAPGYISIGSGNAYTNYAAPQQDAGIQYPAQATYPQYAMPQQPSQPGYQPTTAPKPRKPGISKGLLALLVVLALLLIGGGILFAYVGVIQPNQ